MLLKKFHEIFGMAGQGLYRLEKNDLTGNFAARIAKRMAQCTAPVIRYLLFVIGS